MPRNLGDMVRSAVQKAIYHPDQESSRPSFHTNADTDPYLPDQRPRPITPTESHSQRVQTCFFFSKLPTEIRRDILILAFGSRTLHMYLINEYPVVGGVIKGSRSYKSTNSGTGLRVDNQIPKRWIWNGCVCQRNHPPAASIKPEEWTGHWLGPWADKCLDARLKYSPEPRSQWPKKYHIGVMGWLLSCRQAYVEGIDVLYKTNIIQIQGNFLLSNIDKMILPQRLASICYLELNLRAGFDDEAERNQSHGLGLGTLSTLGKILHVMPALKRILLSIRIPQLVGDSWLPQVYNSILKAGDQFCKAQLENNVHFEVPLTLALPSAAVLPMKKEAKRHGSEFDTSKPFLLWRTFDEGNTMTQLRYSTYPKAPFKLLDSEPLTDCDQLSLGYWIMEGLQPSPDAATSHHQHVFYPAFDIST